MKKDTEPTSEFDKVAKPVIQRFLRTMLDETVFHNQEVKVSPEAVISEGLRNVAQVAEFAQYIGYLFPEWNEKFREQQRLTINELLVLGYQDAKQEVNYIACYYFLYTRQFEDFWNVIEDTGNTNQMLVQFLLVMIENGETEMAQDIMSRVDVTNYSHFYFDRLIDIYQKREQVEDREAGLLSLKGQIKHYLTNIERQIAEDLSGDSVTARSLRGKVFSLSKALQKLEDAIQGKRSESNTQIEQVVELMQRIESIEELVGRGEHEVARELATQVIVDLNTAPEKFAGFPSTTANDLLVKVATIFAPFEQHADIVQSCLYYSEQSWYFFTAFFTVWRSEYDLEKLQYEYQRGLQLFPEHAVDLHEAFAVQLAEVDPEEGLDFVLALPDQEYQVYTLAFMVMHFSKQGNILPNWREYVRHLIELEDALNQIKAANPDFESSLHTHHQYAASLNHALTALGEYSLQKSDWSLFAEVIDTAQLSFNRKAGLLAELIKKMKSKGWQKR